MLYLGMDKEREKKAPITINLLPSVREKADKRARELKRSLSSHIEFLLEQDLKTSVTK